MVQEKLDEEKLEGCWVEDKKSVKKFGNRFSIYFFNGHGHL